MLQALRNSEIFRPLPHRTFGSVHGVRNEILVWFYSGQNLINSIMSATITYLSTKVTFSTDNRMQMDVKKHLHLVSIGFLETKIA